MIANFLQNKWNYALPATAAASWAVWFTSGTCGYALIQLENSGETAIDVAKYAAFTSAATVGLAVIVTLGKAARAGRARFWTTLKKSLSPYDDNPNASRCNIGKPDAIICNTFIAAIAAPMLKILPNLPCWNHSCWGCCLQGEAQNEMAPPMAAAAELAAEIEGAQPVAVELGEVVLAAGGDEFEEGGNGN